MLRFGKLHRKAPHVNMIPIINVIFLLLVYFLVQGSMGQVPEESIKVPTSKSGKPISTDPIQLIMTSQGMEVEGKKLDEEQFREEIIKLAKENPGKQIVLKADAELDSTRMLSMLKVIKQAGVDNIYLLTQQPGMQ